MNYLHKIEGTTISSSGESSSDILCNYQEHHTSKFGSQTVQITQIMCFHVKKPKGSRQQYWKNNAVLIHSFTEICDKKVF